MIALADALVILTLAGLGGLAAAGPALLPAVWIAATTPLLVRSDLCSRRLPNVLTLPGLGILVGCLTWKAFHDPPGALAAGTATLATAAVAYAAALTPGVGMGDAKLGTLVVGSIAMIRVDLIVALAVVASLASIAIVVRGTVTARGRGQTSARGRSTTIAFGPCLLLGYWAAVAGAIVVA